MNKLYPIIKQHFSISYRRCYFCNKIFRFKGFKIKEYNKLTNRSFFSHCCTKCAQTEDDVLYRIQEINKIGEENYEI